MDDDAHEIGLGGGDCADGLEFGERRRFLRGKDWGEGGGVVSEDLSGSEEVLAGLGFLGDIVRGLLLGGDRLAPEGRDTPVEEVVEGRERDRGAEADD